MRKGFTTWEALTSHKTLLYLIRNNIRRLQSRGSSVFPSQNSAPRRQIPRQYKLCFGSRPPSHLYSQARDKEKIKYIHVIIQSNPIQNKNKNSEQDRKLRRLPVGLHSRNATRPSRQAGFTCSRTEPDSERVFMASVFAKLPVGGRSRTATSPSPGAWLAHL